MLEKNTRARRFYEKMGLSLDGHEKHEEHPNGAPLRSLRYAQNLRRAVLRFDVFGKDVLVERSIDGWDVFYLGNEGKRRVANDIMIPNDLKQEELLVYIADLCHEWASKKYPDVKRVG